MKNILFAFGLFTVAAYAAETAATTPSVAQPTDQASVAYMQAAQMGKLAAEGAPGNGRYFPPVPADPNLPTLWIIGDSTVRNGTLGDGTNMGQWGWGAPLTYYFDVKKINVVNRAFGGTTSMSFYNGFFWKNMEPQIKKGDFVILQFGANSGELPGVGDEVQGDRHSFGWYLKQIVQETRARGATPILCTLTPRKGDITASTPNTHIEWTAQVAKEVNAPYINLHDLIVQQYKKMDKSKVDTMYSPTPTEALHTGWDGAVVNAECVVSGLEALKDFPLDAMLNSRGKAVPAASVEYVALNSASALPAATSATK